MRKLSKKMLSCLVVALFAAFVFVSPAKASLECPYMTEDSLCTIWTLDMGAEGHAYYCAEHDYTFETNAHYSEDGDEICDFCGHDPNDVPPSGDDDYEDSEIEALVKNGLGPEAIAWCIESGYVPFSVQEVDAGEEGAAQIEVTFSDVAREMLTAMCAEYGLDESVLAEYDLLKVATFYIELDETEYEYTGSAIEPGFDYDMHFYGDYAFFLEYGNESYHENVEPGAAYMTYEFWVAGSEEPLTTIYLDYTIVSEGEGGGTTPPSVNNEGWRENSTGVWYQYADGTYPAAKWAEIDGEWYYFNASGYLAYGWLKSGANWYYLDDETGAMYANDVYVDAKGNMYYFDDSGKMVTGWHEVPGIWEDPETGEIYEYVDWYYLHSSGAMAKGWTLINGKWYYFDTDDGWMYVGGPVTIGNGDYIFDETGAMVTGWHSVEVSWDDETWLEWYYCEANGNVAKGWKTINGKTYYFNEYGTMYADGYYWIDEETYFFDKSGALVVGWYKDIFSYEEDGEIIEAYDWYYYFADGTLATGWQKINGVWYYFDEDSGWMYSDGVYYIDDEIYYFNKSGAMQASGWIKEVYEFDDGETYTTWYYANPNGTLKTDWAKINGIWYYFSEDDGYMYSNCWHYENDTWYAFDKSGAMVTGWYLMDSHEWEDCLGNTHVWNSWVYTNSDGTAYTGWIKSGGNWYYINEGDMFGYTTLVDEDKIYCLQENGALCTKPGWFKFIGYEYVGWVYVENTSGELATGWKTIDGVDYYFTSDYYDYYDAETDMYHTFNSGEMLYSCSISMNGYEYVFDASGACVAKNPLPV